MTAARRRRASDGSSDRRRVASPARPYDGDPVAAVRGRDHVHPDRRADARSGARSRTSTAGQPAARVTRRGRPRPPARRPATWRNRAARCRHRRPARGRPGPVIRPAEARRRGSSARRGPTAGRTTPRHGVSRSSPDAAAVTSPPLGGGEAAQRDEHGEARVSSGPVTTPGEGSLRKGSVRLARRCPRAAAAVRPRASNSSPAGAGSSATRQTWPPTRRRPGTPRRRAARPGRVLGGQRSDGVDRAPIRSSAPPSGAARSVTSAPSPATSPRPSSSANRKRPDSPAAAALAHSSRVQVRQPRPYVGGAAPVEPGQGRGHHVAYPLVPREGSSPAVVQQPGQLRAAAVVRPRSWTLPREVRCSSPSPSRRRRLAQLPPPGGPVSTPPGIRIRASAPSSAACSRSAPGHASPRSRETAVAWDDGR